MTRRSPTAKASDDPKAAPRRPSPGRAQGSDGLNERERAFVRERRADTVSTTYEIMRRAGYNGNDQSLGLRGRALLQKPKILAALYAPSRPEELLDVEDEDSLKKEMRRLFLQITRASNASHSDKIKAADKLLATIQGGYVPVQIDTRGKLTLESLVSAMGGAPAEVQAALPPTNEGAEQGAEA